MPHAGTALGAIACRQGRLDDAKGCLEGVLADAPHTAMARLYLARVHDYLRTFPNLISAGRQGLFNHNNMDHCIAMGRAAARCVQAHDAPAAPWCDDLDQFDNFRIVD